LYSIKNKEKPYKYKRYNQTMEITLKKRPKNPIVINGFPGFGLVSTISTEFLISHLNAKPIGYFWSDKLSPFIALHDSKIMEPLGIFYDQKHNIVIVHAMSPIQGLEWELADAVVQLCKQLKAKELISLEGVASKETTVNPFYYTNLEKKKKQLEKIGIKPLKEGLIIGVTGALLVKAKNIPFSSIFVEAHINIADSQAAAKIIEVLDKYLNLKVDYKPLLVAAKKFEEKLKDFMERTKEVTDQKEKRELTYLG
jgi:uncharacterized protein